MPRGTDSFDEHLARQAALSKRQQMRRITKEVALAGTGYGDQEADAYAQGVADALCMVARLPHDEHAMRDMALHLVRLSLAEQLRRLEADHHEQSVYGRVRST
jgi:hypothetical protein